MTTQHPAFSVKVASHNLRVRFMESILWGDRVGTLRSAEQSILVSADAQDQAQKSTVMHELVHFIGDVYGLDLSEQTEATLASAFFSLIRENDELVTWMCKQSDIHGVQDPCARRHEPFMWSKDENCSGS